MAGEWIIIEDKPVNGKRFVKIKDIPNNREYHKIFMNNASSASILARFKETVQTHRSEIARNSSSINLINFEAGL